VARQASAGPAPTSAEPEFCPPAPSAAPHNGSAPPDKGPTGCPSSSSVSW